MSFIRDKKMNTTFYSYEELKALGMKKCGNNVLISRKASIYSPETLSVGNNVRIDDFCVLSGNISIGNYVHIAAYSALYGGVDGIIISDFANISSRVSVYSISDDYSGETMTNPMIPSEYKNIESASVHIKKHVIIGSTSVVLPGSILEDGCSFGALSLIKGNYEGWNIYAGIPAKKVKNRRRDILELERKFLEEKND